MIKSLSKFLFLLSILTFGLYAEDAANGTTVYMLSISGDPIVLDEEIGLFEVKPIKPANSNQIKGFSVLFFSGKGHSWQFKFMIPAIEQIITGKTYAFAETYPYQPLDQPGIKVCFLDKDHNDLRGEFKILEYSLDTKGKVTSLAIDFKQVKGGKGTLYGSIRHNSKIDLTTDFIPQPIEDNGILVTDKLHKHLLQFYSTPGEYVKQGYFITEDSPFKPSVSWGNTVKIWIHSNRNWWWNAIFQAPFEQRLEKGIYLDATRWPFNDNNAGIDFGGSGRGCNSILGHFEVLEIKYGIHGDIEELAIDFVQHCEFSSGYPLRGTIRYNTYIRPSTEDEIQNRLE